MTINRIFEKYEQHTRQWIQLLEQLPEHHFTYKPAPFEWSVSELADHLANVTHKCLDNALLCAQEKGETGHSGFGPALFSMIGSFPPIKLRITKIPPGLERIYHPVAITKTQAMEGLTACLQRMKELKEISEQAGKKQRVAHWAGGWFNAKQWYHSAEMHLKHHFRQYKRLEKQFPE